MKLTLRKGALWFMLTGLIAAASVASAQEPNKAPDDDGEMKKLVERACTSCHGLDMIESAQKSKDEWTEVTRNMISYGADIKESQIESVAKYLAKYYGLKK